MRTIRPSSCRLPARAAIAVFSAALLFAGCGGGDGGSTDPTPPPGVTVLSLVSGDGQRARITRTLPLPIVVLARASNGSGVSGTSVTFTTSSGSIDPATVTTDAAGQASVRWTVGVTSGPQTLSARLSSGAGTPVTVTATADPALVVSLTTLDGDRQQAVTSTVLPVSPRIVVRDTLGTPLSGINLRVNVTGGGGSITNTAATTDAAGAASFGAWTLGAATGTNTVTVTPTDADVVASAPLLVTAVAVAPGGVTSSPMRSYVLNATGVSSVRDSVTGQTFRFPDGAHGTLDVARVLSNPEAPVDGVTPFRAAFSGPEVVEVVVAPPLGGTTLAYIFGDSFTANTQGTLVSRWWGMPPSRAVGDSVYYPLQTDASLLLTASLRNGSRALPRGGRSLASLGAYAFDGATTLNAGAASAGTYIVVALPSSSPWTSRSALYRDAVQQTIDWWLAQLPASDAARTRATIAAHNPLAVTYGLRGTSGYDYVRRWLRWYPTLYFADRQPALLEKLSRHEAGHYLAHMMLGDAAYQTLTNNGPIDTLHFPGGIARGTRQSLSEEYAYASEFFMMGSLNSMDLRSLSYANNARTLMQDQSPSSIDFPSLEGFGAIMMAALTRAGDDTLVYDFWTSGSRTRSPALGISSGAILGVLAKGPQNPNQLRAALQTLAGSEGALAAVLEPMGWSYEGSGRVMDGAGQPVAGATVRSVVSAGGKEYRTFESALTGADGRFILRRIYPGTSTLRVYKQNGLRLDSLDAKQLTVPWETTTTTSQALGDLTMLGLTGHTRIYITVSGFVSANTAGSTTCKPNFSVINELGGTSSDAGTLYPLLWNGNAFSANGTAAYSGTASTFPARINEMFSVSGTLDAARNDSIWVTLTASSNWRVEAQVPGPSGPTWQLSINQPALFTLRGVPLVSNGAVSPTYRANLTGAAAAAVISNYAITYFYQDALIPTFLPQTCNSYTLNTTNASVGITLRTLGAP